MKIRLCDVNPAALGKLPPGMEDKSGIGVHYVDAFIKPMNRKLEDGTAIKCKRRGLRIALTAGAAKGEGLDAPVDRQPGSGRHARRRSSGGGNCGRRGDRG